MGIGSFSCLERRRSEYIERGYLYFQGPSSTFLNFCPLPHQKTSSWEVSERSSSQSLSQM